MLRAKAVWIQHYLNPADMESDFKFVRLNYTTHSATLTDLDVYSSMPLMCQKWVREGLDLQNRPLLQRVQILVHFYEGVFHFQFHFHTSSCKSHKLKILLQVRCGDFILQVIRVAAYHVVTMEPVNHPVMVCSVNVQINSMVNSVRFLYPVSN